MGRLPRGRLHGRLLVEALTRPAAPVLAVALVAAAWLVAAPPVADLAAHDYRAWLFDTEGGGVALWNLQWYGGHHVPGYSLTFPPLAGVLGAPVAVAVAGVAAAAALVPLARAHPAAAWLLAAAAAANLVTGRGPFLLGVAFAALALRWRERGLGRTAALLAAAASPIAGLFLCLAAIVIRRPWLAVGPGLLIVVLAVLFPEGGAERFVATAFWPMLALTLAAAWLLDGRWRIGALLYAAALAAAFLIDTPMGHNATRLGVLAGPAMLAVAGRGPRPAVIAVAAGLLYLGVLPAVRAVVESHGDPAARASFHAPLLGFLDRAAAPGDRVEIAFTRNHWEATHVARRFPLARGWERQLDLKYNGLFYDGTFSAATYERWLRHEGIRWVALPDAPLDFSAREEAALLRRGAPFLREAFRGGGWRVWELRGAPAPVDGPGEIVRTEPQRIELRAHRPGVLRLRYRWARTWVLTRGRARLRERDGRIEVQALQPGAIVLDGSNTRG